MNKIDISIWKKFKISDLFDIHPTKEHGLTNVRLMSDFGKNPVVVNSQYNNGVGGYTEKEVTEKGNIITFSDTTSSNTIFYQEHDFVGYPHVQGMYPIGKYKEKWNKYSYLFFVTVFRTQANLRYFDYVNKFTRENASLMEVKLPVTKNNEIDFLYMENYIKNLQTTVSNNLDKLLSAEYQDFYKLDIDSWEDFEIEKIFRIKRPNSRSSKKYELGEVPFISSGAYNNGVESYKKPHTNEELDKGNCITISPVDGSTFYQPTNFLGRGGGGSSIILLYNDNLNKYNGLFLSSIIQITLQQKYNYSDMGGSENIKKEKIKLPITDNGEIDYNYMSNYMKNILEIQNRRLDLLNAI